MQGQGLGNAFLSNISAVDGEPSGGAWQCSAVARRHSGKDGGSCCCPPDVLPEPCRASLPSGHLPMRAEPLTMLALTYYCLSIPPLLSTGIFHVCRAFDDADVVHVEDRVDPVEGEEC